jgi:hypothetical protein
LGCCGLPRFPGEVSVTRPWGIDRDREQLDVRHSEKSRRASRQIPSAALAAAAARRAATAVGDSGRG